MGVLPENNEYYVLNANIIFLGCQYNEVFSEYKFLKAPICKLPLR